MRNLDITHGAVRDFEKWCKEPEQGMHSGFLLNLSSSIEQYLKAIGYFDEEN